MSTSEYKIYQSRSGNWVVAYKTDWGDFKHECYFNTRRSARRYVKSELRKKAALISRVNLPASRHEEYWP